jgi:hypothetical protein
MGIFRKAVLFIVAVVSATSTLFLLGVLTVHFGQDVVAYRSLMDLLLKAAIVGPVIGLLALASTDFFKKK